MKLEKGGKYNFLKIINFYSLPLCVPQLTLWMVVFASIDFEMCWKLSFCLCINMAMWEWEKLFKMHHPFYWSNFNRHWRLWAGVSACLIKVCCCGGLQKQIRQCRLATRLGRESRNLKPAVRWLENYLWEVFCCCILGYSATLPAQNLLIWNDRALS